jgi:hypothetical protein
MEKIANAADLLADHVHEYPELLRLIQARFDMLTIDPKVRLFTTRADNLWSIYLDSLPVDRQYHTCHCCRRFIETYGGLVTIDESGVTHSAIWSAETAGPFYGGVVQALSSYVEHQRVTGVFVSDEQVWGTPSTGPWTHFAVTPSWGLVHRSIHQTAHQAAAEKLQDYSQVQAALIDYDQRTLTTAIQLLETDSLYQSEKCLGVAKWLLERRRERTECKPYSSNLLWRAIASAPPGYAHPRSSMIGTLLDDIAAGKPFEAVAAAFKAKMHPLRYQRPQAAPSQGAIQAAEKLVSQLGIERSLERRYARLEELEADWRPTPRVDSAPKSVFGHLKPKDETVPELKLPVKTMTWSLFLERVLPTADRIELLVPPSGSFVAFVTAQHADAPPILQWDLEGRRNPMSLYVYHPSSNAHNWGLQPSTWVSVEAIAKNPAAWGQSDPGHHGKSVSFILKGARDSRHDSIGNALFPANLKAELHGVRSVVEAYSKTARIGGFDESSACGLVINQNGGRLFGTQVVLRVRVKDADVTMKYHLDRWE